MVKGSLRRRNKANNHKQFTVRKTVNPRKLLAQRTCTVRQELKSSGNKIFLRTVDLHMNESPEIYYYARLFESPDLYWSFDELC